MLLLCCCFFYIGFFVIDKNNLYKVDFFYGKIEIVNFEVIGICNIEKIMKIINFIELFYGIIFFVGFYFLVIYWMIIYGFFLI